MAEAGAPAARCRLYLSAPAVPPADFATMLEAALHAADVACIRLTPGPDVQSLIRTAQGRGCAALLAGRPDLVASLEADGVHLHDVASYEEARGQLGPAASIGVYCGGSRHLAMEAAEAGADYVALDPDLELVLWWAELMVVPVVVELGDALDRAGEFIAAGADFICPGEGVWREGNVLGALRRLVALKA